MLQVGLAIAGDLLLDAIESDLRDRARENDLDVLILDEPFSAYTPGLLRALCDALAGIVLIGDITGAAHIERLLGAGVDAYLYRGDALRPLLDAALKSAFA